ncbi:hypothetical protein CPB86DRAFT_704855 [Serendipita vermifera]|nr:hypothetical protein CPB86DRAFT_704855 [Serendipita vermifera]
MVVGDGREFTQLHMLKWMNHHEECYPHCSFPFLTEIYFDDDYEPPGASHFCQLLLRYSRMCPRLQKISIHGYPEWDMLLYMLLRRNTRHNQDNISRITSLELPGYPAPYILVPVSTLLSGKIPLEMPSLEELSYVDNLFNPSIPGCTDRINCRLPCRTPIPSGRFGNIQFGPGRTSMGSKGVPTSTAQPQESDPPLPTYLQDWVDSWQKRKSLWKQREPQWGDIYYGKREGHCARHNYSRFVVIGGYTLDGPYASILSIRY